MVQFSSGKTRLCIATCGMSVTALALFVMFACDKYAMAVVLLGVLLVINC